VSIPIPQLEDANNDEAPPIWDNRAVQHYACSDYWPDVRGMERASIVGERPG